MPPLKLVGDWAVANAILADTSRLRRAIDDAVYAEAQYARGQIVKGLKTQAPGGKRLKPPSKLTLAIRRMQGFKGTKALLVSGTLMRSVTAVRAGHGKAFVGVLRSAKGSNGKPEVNIAAINEHGAVFVVRVTPKMRAFLMAAIAKSGAKKNGGGRGMMARGVMVVKIPARPFIAPVIEQILKDPAALQKRFGHRIMRSMGFAFGSV